MANSWDFYKPALDSEYPEVDGQLSLYAYVQAFEEAYITYKNKENRRTKILMNGSATNGTSDHGISVKSFDYMAFHGPYGKMVQKGFGRMVSLPSFIGLFDH